MCHGQFTIESSLVPRGLGLCDVYGQYFRNTSQNLNDINSAYSHLHNSVNKQNRVFWVTWRRHQAAGVPDPASRGHVIRWEWGSANREP